MKMFNWMSKHMCIGLLCAFMTIFNSLSVSVLADDLDPDPDPPTIRYVITLDRDRYTYDGTEHEPGITVSVDETHEIIPASEYTVTYENNKNAGEAKVIIQSTEESEHEIDVSTNFTINKAPLMVSANNLSKKLGTADPALTYTVNGLVNNEKASDVLSGSLVREEGEDVGPYDIMKGTLTCNSNYDMRFSPGTFTITNPGHSDETVYDEIRAGKDITSLTRTVDLGTKLVSGGTLRSTSVESEDFTAEQIRDVSIADGKVQYTLKNVRMSSKGNLNLKIKKEGYDDYTITVSINVVRIMTVKDDFTNDVKSGITGVSSSNLEDDYSLKQDDYDVVVTLQATTLKDGTKAMNDAITKAYKKGKTVHRDYVDIKLFKSVNQAPAVQITDTGVVLAIEVAYNQSNKEDIYVFREHTIGTIEQFERLTKRPDGSSKYKDKTYFCNGKDTVTIYSSLFSDFAITHCDPVVATPTPKATPTPSANKTWTVTFNNNGSLTYQYVENNKKAVKPTDPTRNGYVFKGWYKDGSLYNFNNPVTSSFTLMAVWEAASTPTPTRAPATPTPDYRDVPKTGDPRPGIPILLIAVVIGLGAILTAKKILSDPE